MKTLHEIHQAMTKTAAVIQGLLAQEGAHLSEENKTRMVAAASGLLILAWVAGEDDAVREILARIESGGALNSLQEALAGA